MTLKRGALLFGIGLGLSALLTACGGGGGSGGTSAQEYQITLRADQQRLPVNIGSYPPSAGVTAPYTTTLYVNATTGGAPIPGGTDVFACNLEAGLSVGSLVYLDGNHLDDKKNELHFRSITLGANSGGNSFHFHAGDEAGSARIRCSVTDPRDGKVKSATVDISVGNTVAPAAGMPASVNVQAESPTYLGTRYNMNSVRNNIAVQAMVRDETNQWVADTTTPNLYVYIQAGSASDGARLVSGKQSGTAIMTNTLNGIANFSLSSGADVGAIVLAMVADRADNNVANGIQDPVVQYLLVPVWNGVPQTPLTLAAQTISATCNQRVSYALTASGGVPPYRWTASDLPQGLTLSDNGLITGVPASLNGANNGSFPISVTVSDSNYPVTSPVTQNMTITVDAGDCKPLAMTGGSFAAEKDQPFQFLLSASGGTAPYKWKLLGSAFGLSLGETTGILSGSLSMPPSTYNLVVEVTDKDGIAVKGTVTIKVSDPSAAPVTP